MKKEAKTFIRGRARREMLRSGIMMRIFLCATLFAFTLAVPASSQSAAPSEDLVSGINAYNSGDFAAARDHLQAAANRGDAEAMVNLGYLYARGQGVRTDSAFALTLYQRAADASDAEGMNAVGYRYNFAPRPDLDKAIHWYCMAVLRGNPRAMNNVALLFYFGQGVARDREEARSLWRQAADQGNTTAQANLGEDLWSDPSLSDAQRQAGQTMLRDAAQKGAALAQQYLRKHGDTEAFPPAFDTSLAMRLEPRDPVSGSSRLCGDLIS